MRDVNLLLVEDNMGDVVLIKRALAGGTFVDSMQVVDDGEKAVQYVKQEGEFAGAMRPDIIMLDLNIPKLSGREVLKILKNDEQFRSIPIIIMSSSDAEEDVDMCYQLHANCFVRKPVTLEEFTAAMKTLEVFWGSIARLPQ